MGVHERVSREFRSKRMDFFFRLVERVPKPATLLDVGGTTEFWRGRIPKGCRITLLNLFPQAAPDGGEALVGDGCDLVRFGNSTFDIVFSNSVLCLVGGERNRSRMAAEIRRVGRRYYVQTANRDFPLDWRTLMPFFHFLPPARQEWFFQRMPVGRYRRARSREEARDWATRVEDVTLSQFKSLFPEGQVLEEKVLGLTKSFVCHHGFQ